MDFFHTTVTKQAIQRVTQTLESGFLSEGKVVAEFENTLQSEFGIRNPVCTNSGTSALHLALIAAGVGEGDEVVTTPQTFIATAMAIKYCGATPVFADIDPTTGNLTAASVEAKITHKTRAILFVDWAGYPAYTEALANVAYRYGLVLIEDAAHSFGATYENFPVGGIPSVHITCFSFQAVKHVTTGDGGAVCFQNDKPAAYMKRLRWFGVSKEYDLPDELGERQYNLIEPGYKYHMNDIAASIGLGNLDGIRACLTRRRVIASRYFAELRGVAGLDLMNYTPGVESSYWLFPVRVRNRKEFVRCLQDKGTPTSVVHQRIDRHSLFGGVNEDLIGMDEFDKHQIHLPIHDGLTDEDVDLIIGTIRGGW